ncbi:hypothetical protein ACSSV8_001474, partial [Roseovarius sp. MBR-79]
MRGMDETSGSLFNYVDLEQRIPERHPLREIRQVVMYGWLPRGKRFSVDAGMISVAAMYTASELQHG